MVHKAFPTKVLLALLAALVLVGAVVAVGAVLRDGNGASSSAASNGPTTSTAPKVTTTTLPPTTTTTLPAFAQPAPAQLPPAPIYGNIGPGYDPAVVKAYQQRLTDLKFDPGPIDGNYGQAMVYAVQAVQKIYNLDRNGHIGPAEKTALESFQYPAPLHPEAEPNRTEIDVTKQTLTLYQNSQVRLITTTSTASGVHYCYNTPRINPTQHICEIATTPSGRFTYYDFRPGWDKGVLGALYNPFYFNKGIAVHGYAEVPPQPASHGCSRIPMHIAEYFHTLVNVGDPVYVEGGSPAVVLSSNPI